MKPDAIARAALAAFYALAGAAHLLWPEPFIRITPDWVPAKPIVVAATGVFEIVAAAALLITATRKWAGLALAAYALAVWPANVKHAIEGIEFTYLPASWWWHGPRLALQPFLIAAALWAGGWIGRGRRSNPRDPTEAA
jgi:uncharacterized membrane protein